MATAGSQSSRTPLTSRSPSQPGAGSLTTGCRVPNRPAAIAWSRACSRSAVATACSKRSARAAVETDAGDGAVANATESESKATATTVAEPETNLCAIEASGADVVHRC